MDKLLLPCILAISLITCCIEVELAVPGFPAMAHYFHVSESMIQLIIIINLLAFALAAWFYGPLSEAYGRRRLLIIANALMALGALGCMMASELSMLYVSRFIQGLGAAGNAVLVFAVIADVYQGQAAVRLLAYFNGLFTTSMAFAPVLGGMINQVIGWRGNFALLALISVLAFGLQIIKLPETIQTQKKLSLRSCLHDYMRLTRHLRFVVCAIIPSLIYACYITFVAYAPFVYMNLGCSLMKYTLLQSIIIALFAITSLSTPSIMRMMNDKQALILGLVFSAFGIWGLLFISFLGVTWPEHITLFMSFYSIGSAILYPIIFNQSMGIFPELNGVASSFVMGLRTMMMALIVWVTAWYFHGDVFEVAVVLSSILLIICSGVYFILRSPQAATESVSLKAKKL